MSVTEFGIHQKTSYKAAKRIFDIVASALATIVLLPLFPLIAIIIRITSVGPVLFRQTRLGKDGVPFMIYKFRTMKHNAPVLRNTDGSRFVGEDDPRLTGAGRFLRDYSLDELPQLFNILKGDMSVVGPRPDTPDAPGMNANMFMKKRMVRPGLTSLASIHGRNGISWKHRVALEAEYVEKASLALDAYILFKTIPLVLRRQGIYSHKSEG